MKIVAISDTHGKNIVNVVRGIKHVDIIIHLGDFYKDAFCLENELKIPVYYVKGNCDYAPEIPAEKLLKLSNKKVFITHGHRYNVKLGLDELKNRAFEEGANIVLYGHTHEPKICIEDNTLFLNPGSTTYPNTGNYPTIGIINIVDSIIESFIENIV